MTLIRRLSLNLSLLGKFWQQPVNSRFFQINLAVIATQILYLFINFRRLPPQVPLYYSQPWGLSQLASAGELFYLPILSVIILLLNNSLAAFYLHRYQLLSRLLLLFSSVFSLLSLITLFQIIRLIT